MSREKILEAMRRVCGGEDDDLKKLGLKPCKHYDAHQEECLVLKARKIPDVLNRDHEQCQLIVKYYADRLLDAEWRRGRRLTDGEELNFPGLFTRLQKKTSKGFNQKKGQRYSLEYWHRYIRKAVHRIVIERQRDLRVIHQNEQCGTCVHRQSQAPFQCRLEHLPNKPRGKKSPNPFFKKERKEQDTRCPGYRSRKVSLIGLPLTEASPTSVTEAVVTGSEEAALIAGVDLSMLLDALTEKMRDPSTGKTDRKRFQRQRTFIIEAHHLLRQGIDGDEVFRELRKRKTDDPRKRDSLRNMMKEDLKALNDFYRSRR